MGVFSKLKSFHKERHEAPGDRRPHAGPGRPRFAFASPSAVYPKGSKPGPSDVRIRKTAAVTQRTRVRPRTRVARADGGCLVIIAGPRLGHCIEVHDTPVVVGRAPDVDFQIEHASVSRHHCSVARDEGGYFVMDLGSKNGTRVNGFHVSRDDLSSGDHIGIGDIVLRFVTLDSVEARYHEALFQLAARDSLTQLYNRREFALSVDEAVRELGTRRVPLSLAILDLDHFKSINDRFGHAAGDAALGQVAVLLRNNAHDGVVAGRLGGDEFAVLFRNMELPDAIRWCETQRLAVESLRFEFGGDEPCVTISIGLAAWQPEMKGGRDLMSAADAQLLRTKEHGRNSLSVA